MAILHCIHLAARSWTSTNAGLKHVPATYHVVVQVVRLGTHSPAARFSELRRRGPSTEVMVCLRASFLFHQKDRWLELWRLGHIIITAAGYMYLQDFAR
jgi:hypothetical protein